ncbi:MAG: hypothetical protein R3C40_03205 [Parvularculaceae bacterium]
MGENEDIGGRVSALAILGNALPDGVAPRHDGEGQYDRLVIRGATLIDGSSAPPVGPSCYRR